MTKTESCQSCTMTIESGPYCQYCADEHGQLIAFAEAFARFIQWTNRHEPGLDPAAAEEKTLAFMQTMPAWQEHPGLRAELEARSAR